MGNKQGCAARAQELYQFFQTELVSDSLYLDKAPNNGQWHFKIRLTKPTDNYDSVSISVPPDAEGNGEGESCQTFETALFLKGELVYVHSIGYDDVRRFFSKKRLLEEVLRLAKE